MADTPSVGAGQTLSDGWVDISGNLYSVSLGLLKATTSDGSGYLINFFLRPTVEASQDSRIVEKLPAGALGALAIEGLALRYAAGDYYLAHSNADTVLIYKIVSGSVTLISSNSWSGVYDASHIYEITFSANGANATNLSLVVFDSTSGHQVASIITSDSASSLQSSGRQGVVSWAITPGVAGTATFSRLRTFSGAGPSAIILGVIGDSIQALDGGTVAIQTAAFLSDMDNPRQFFVGSNQAISGTHSSDWVSGSTNLNNAISAFHAANVTHVPISIGVNDSRLDVLATAGTYQTNMAGIASALVAEGFIVVLNAPTYTVPGSLSNWDASSNALQLQYATRLMAIANGTTILMGDSATYAYFLAHTTELSDGVHPTSTGETSLALLQAQAFYRALYPALSGNALQPLRLGGVGSGFRLG